MSDTDENKATSTKILLGASNSDHDAYDSSYYTVTIAKGQLLEIEKFTNDVRKACKDYLEHSSHHGLLNQKVSNGSTYYDIKNYPVPLTSGSTTSGCVAWSTTVNDIMTTVDEYIASFKTNNSLKVITASSTWDFLVSCFHATHRIAEQRFSYYKSLNSSSATTVYSIGLLELYQTLDEYKSSVSGFASDKTIMIQVGSDIVAINVSNAIHKLMNYNANHELVYDHGARNRKNNYSQYVWGTSYYECDEGPFYDAWQRGAFAGLYVYYKMKWAPSGVADHQDKGSIWHYNYSDDHGHVYQTKTQTVNELVANNPNVQTYNIHQLASIQPVLFGQIPKTNFATTNFATIDAIVKTPENIESFYAIGSVSGLGDYEIGTRCTLIACAANGYTFVRWEDGSTNSIRQIQVEKDATYTAFFETNQYTINVIEEDSTYNKYSSISSKVYQYYDYAVICAPEKNSYKFNGWKDVNSKSIVFSTKHQIEIHVTGNATYVASYSKLN